ncbi:HET-domain-containing protein [Didymella exigua CBS 183.55]|uniref:HET-domain-containing protein n=1 Tax=Didymella exigua CBS 183.55 TaxID=1150837 RepID=A0A6A5S075_9PLEO|nr:HET-domain-containing protein [Didymella exigua CBS 183.55]KAF1932678.1 HET-domain-containing protein [Didymella exigua CBS 183.55]
MKEKASIGERFPWRPDVSDDREHLCDRCSALNLGSYSDVQEEKERGTIAFIEKASMRRGCKLCKQFGCIFAALESIRKESSGHSSFTLDYRRLRTERWNDFYIRVRFMEFSKIFDFDFDFYPTTPLDLEDSWIPIVKTMTSNTSNLDLAQRWLRICQSSHARCQRLQARCEILRVIDCREKTLRLIDSSEPYACLSYVWGDHPTGEKGDWTSTLRRAPRTIQDAMSVTLSLGIAYLWVDRYCIDQDNPEEKHEIIRSMDLIYQGAEITIVAPTGPDPHYGLPGVDATPRRCQLSLAVGKHTFVSTENMREQIHAAVWSSRGWTYQEMLMSRRRIVFTDSQMYFQCASAVWLESLDLAATDPQSQLYEQFRVFPTFEANNGFDEIQNRLKEYYQRRLSFKTDAIHAFSGICNAHVTDAGPVALTHFYGVPIVFPDTCHQIAQTTFIEALNWRILHRDSVLEPLMFPLIFPSWSWASVKARSSSNSNEGEYIKPYHFCTDQADLRISLQSKRGYQVELGKILAGHVRTEYTSFEPVLCITGYVLRGCFTRVVSGAAGAGGLQLDSRDVHDFSNVVALLLGVTREPSIGRSHGLAKRYKFHCLLIERLTPQQLLHSKCSSNGQSGFRRIGVWTPPILPSAVGGDDFATSESIRALLIDRMSDEKGAWTWSRETLSLF